VTADEQATPPRSSPVADALSIASDFGAAWAAVSALQVLSGRRTARAATVRLAATGVAALVLTRWLKHRFAVPRTAGAAATLARTPTSTRFPSGHTLAAFLAACTIPRTSSGRALALGFAAGVGWSRVAVGHHRPVDVVAGAGVGTVAGVALARVLATAA
jgi:membrane-associated phospholipid phosphatase